MSQVWITNLYSIGPAILVTVAALLLVVIDIITSDKQKAGVGYFGIFLMICALLVSCPGWFMGTNTGFGNTVRWDTYSFLFFGIFTVAYTLTTLGSVKYLKERNIMKGEFYIILMMSIIGMMFMVSALDLSVFYVGLETMAISMYILAGYDKRSLKSNEAGLKYFMIGAFSSGLLLFGMSYVYGATGTINYMEIAAALKGGAAVSKGFIFGMVLMLVGFAFKVSAVPFHMWAPDVYTGAPTPVAGFMTVAPKAAAAGAIVRFVMLALAPVADQWQLFFSILAVLTMTYGNLVAMAQTNVKRMLAYSAISHAGYMMIAIVALGSNVADEAYRAIIVYMFVYAFMNIGAFTILGVIKNKGMIENERLESFNGLSKKSPLTAVAMLIFMFSLAGIPPLAGFAGKFYIFVAAMKAEIYWLAIIGALNSALACYYYMRVTINMYFKEAEYDVEAEVDTAGMIGSTISVFAVLAIGIFPAIIYSLVANLKI